METNVGGTDQSLRIGLGMLLTIIGAVSLLGQALGPILGALLVVVGLVFLWTGYTRQCLLYKPLGINTN
ncbi:YgaP family membrane protein [Halodesulfurarchaeum sp.]|uniref:YgaP family membrane protein n=1 Tax=Halodesulfurarchaeum sp. TaxID=1980530 RepID=UPI001BBFC145|nr:DUF2892 domain-containing protein [Halodesulfurarchaeum sp.]